MTVEWNQPVYEFVKENKSGGPASIVNHGDRVPVDDAVFVNGTFGQGCELDDHYDRGGGRPGAASIHVAMALGERKRVDGKTFISAVVAGYEIGWRVGQGLLPHHKGTPRNPLSREEVRKKFLALGEGVLPKETLDRIIDKVENIDLAADISNLIHLMISVKSKS